MQGTNSSKIKIKSLEDICWRGIFKDVVKFYFYLMLFYGLAALLVWGQAYIDLGVSSASLDQALSDPLSADNIEIKEFNIDTYRIVAEKMSQYMFVLVCFGVFFSVPPKSFKHVAIVALLISLTANTPFFYQTAVEWFYDNLYLCGNILLVWGVSHVWFLLRDKLKT